MRISPIDIQQQQFKTRAFGYDKGAVDRFLEALAEELERLVRQNLDLEEELTKTRTTLAEMREREATLKETLLTTQKVTDELKATARREVEVMLADAELRAERLLRGAEDRRIQLIEQIQEIKRQKIDFETTLRSLLEKHIRMLDMNVLSIAEGGDEPRLLEEPLPFEAAREEKHKTHSGTFKAVKPTDSATNQTREPAREPAAPAVDEAVDIPFDFENPPDLDDDNLYK